MNQISFPAFVASRAASLCPPAGAVQTANDVPALVAQPDASGQRVDTRTHADRRAARRDACYSALQGRGVLSVDRFMLVQHLYGGPQVYSFCLRPQGRTGEVSSFACFSLRRIRSAA